MNFRQQKTDVDRRSDQLIKYAEYCKYYYFFREILRQQKLFMFSLSNYSIYIQDPDPEYLLDHPVSSVFQDANGQQFKGDRHQ